MSSNYRQPFIHPALLRQDWMRVGTDEFGFEEIASYEVGSYAERDWDGQLLCAAGYGFGSALFLIGILIGSLDWKFAIAVVFLGGVCFMSIIDAMGVPTIAIYSLDITLQDGRQVRFIDGDPRVVDTLAARIEHAARRQPRSQRVG